MQLEGLFDIPPSKRSNESWNVEINPDGDWNIGLIVGPSGCGKTTILREIFGEQKKFDFQSSNILDDFPSDMSIKNIVDLLSSVGFSSPPSWVRPYHVLSNGEQFRVQIARTLADEKPVLTFDEFTSVVDRNVAQIASVAIQKSIRRNNKKIVFASCHYDIIDWLEPDWIYDPSTNQFSQGRWLHQRPKIELEIKRVDKQIWQLFKKHHYLSAELNSAAVCFCGFYKGNPAVFTSVLHFPHPRIKNYKREHRTVTLPDYQGVGMGNAMSAFIGSAVRGIGCEFISTTSHPIMIKARMKSDLWKLTKKNGLNSNGGSKQLASMNGTHASTRLVCAFRYIGESMSEKEAREFYYGQ